MLLSDQKSAEIRRNSTLTSYDAHVMRYQKMLWEFLWTLRTWQEIGKLEVRCAGTAGTAGTGYRFGDVLTCHRVAWRSWSVPVFWPTIWGELYVWATLQILLCLLFVLTAITVRHLDGDLWTYGPMDMFEKFWKDAATILRSFWYWQIEATESQQGLRYQLAAGDAALAPDLSFLSVETVRVSIDAWTYTRWDGCTSWDDSIYLAMLHQMCWLSGDIWWSFCLLISLLSSWALRSWAPVSAACLKCRKASKRHRLLGRKSQGMLELFRVLSSVWKVYKPYQTISGGWIWQPPKTSKMHIECGRSEVSSNTPISEACAGAAAEWNALLPSQSYRGAMRTTCAETPWFGPVFRILGSFSCNFVTSDCNFNRFWQTISLRTYVTWLITLVM